MALYDYVCESCDVMEQVSRSIHADPVEPMCRKCQHRMHRVWNRVNIHSFRPFVDPNIATQPIEFASRRERDAYLESHGLTYDTGRYVRPPQVSAADSVTLDEVATEIQKGNVGKALTDDIGDFTVVDKKP